MTPWPSGVRVAALRCATHLLGARGMLAGLPVTMFLLAVRPVGPGLGLDYSRAVAPPPSGSTPFTRGPLQFSPLLAVGRVGGRPTWPSPPFALTLLAGRRPNPVRVRGRPVCFYKPVVRQAHRVFGVCVVVRTEGTSAPPLGANWPHRLSRCHGYPLPLAAATAY